MSYQPRPSGRIVWSWKIDHLSRLSQRVPDPARSSLHRIALTLLINDLESFKSHSDLNSESVLRVSLSVVQPHVLVLDTNPVREMINLLFRGHFWSNVLVYLSELFQWRPPAQLIRASVVCILLCPLSPIARSHILTVTRPPSSLAQDDAFLRCIFISFVISFPSYSGEILFL